MPRNAHNGRATTSGDFEMAFYVSVFLWAGFLPWMNLANHAFILGRKTRAFSDLDVFYASFHEAVPAHVRLLGEAVQDRQAVIDVARIRAILAGHGVARPIDFDQILQVNKKKS